MIHFITVEVYMVFSWPRYDPLGYMPCMQALLHAARPVYLLRRFGDSLFIFALYFSSFRSDSRLHSLSRFFALVLQNHICNFQALNVFSRSISSHFYWSSVPAQVTSPSGTDSVAKGGIHLLMSQSQNEYNEQLKSKYGIIWSGRLNSGQVRSKSIRVRSGQFGSDWVNFGLVGSGRIRVNLEDSITDRHWLVVTC
jgi:hypothetical protein